MLDGLLCEAFELLAQASGIIYCQHELNLTDTSAIVTVPSEACSSYCKHHVSIPTLSLSPLCTFSSSETLTSRTPRSPNKNACTQRCLGVYKNDVLGLTPP